jgi:hypothetical protein
MMRFSDKHLREWLFHSRLGVGVGVTNYSGVGVGVGVGVGMGVGADNLWEWERIIFREWIREWSFIV